MKHFDFISKQTAEQFKWQAERLGWTVSTIYYHEQYGWYVVSNWPF